MPIRMPRRAALLLKTGQLTQYSGEPDDGYTQRGVAKAYEVLTAGQYSGVANIDLIHYAAATISFDQATSKILDSANGLATFKTGTTIVVSGSTKNNGVYTIVTGNVAGEIVVSEALQDEGAGASVSIAKRVTHSNQCVRDRNTGLMWSRYTSGYYGVMGLAGGGAMPWTGQLYDIFQYCAAANAANLGGYADWRIPNDLELASLRRMEAPDAAPDAVAFPGWPTGDGVWTSTVPPHLGAGYAQRVLFASGYVAGADNTAAQYVAMVRG